MKGHDRIRSEGAQHIKREEMSMYPIWVDSGIEETIIVVSRKAYSREFVPQNKDLMKKRLNGSCFSSKENERNEDE